MNSSSMYWRLHIWCPAGRGVVFMSVHFCIAQSLLNPAPLHRMRPFASILGNFRYPGVGRFDMRVDMISHFRWALGIIILWNVGYPWSFQGPG